VARFLFVTWDGGGNKVPAVALAEELALRGHAVSVLGDGPQAPDFAAPGVRFASFSTSRTFPSGSTPLDMVRIASDAAMRRDTLAELAAHPADVIVVDVALFGVMDALRRAGREYVVLEHTLDGVLRRVLPSLDAVLRVRGLRVLRLLNAGRPVLAPTIPELDRGHGDVVHLGPMVRAVPARPAGPTVVLSLSTAPYPALVPTWQRVLDAVEGLPARVVATLGSGLAAGALRIPAGVEVHGWRPHTEILPEASLVVSHGGHGTAVAALAHGVPLLVLPLDRATDQPWIGAAVQRAGVGRRLSRSARPARIRAAVEELLADGPHRGAAARMGERARALDGRTRGADVLEMVARRAERE
jgi:UDP:flavonoid glycosyltransferase YjiC (YdhE family)